MCRLPGPGLGLGTATMQELTSTIAVTGLLSVSFTTGPTFAKDDSIGPSHFQPLQRGWNTVTQTEYKRIPQSCNHNMIADYGIL